MAVSLWPHILATLYVTGSTCSGQFSLVQFVPCEQSHWIRVFRTRLNSVQFSSSAVIEALYNTLDKSALHHCS